MEDRLRKIFNEQFSEALIKEETFRGQLSFYVEADKLFDICQALYENSEIDVRMLTDITSVDWLGHAKEVDGRFELIYTLYSIKDKFRFLIRTGLPADNPKIASVVDIWAGANWMEREVFDLMGIIFEGHPDLRKIITADDLDGHPLRKDFPLTWEQPKFTWNQDDPPEVIK